MRILTFNEFYEYHIINKDGEQIKVTRDEFVKAGAEKGMKPDRKSLLTIDKDNKIVIAKFENYINKL